MRLELAKAPVSTQFIEYEHPDRVTIAKTMIKFLNDLFVIKKSIGINNIIKSRFWIL